MEHLGDRLAALNASLNAASAILVFIGWRAIKSGQRERHRALMLAALGVSAVFLVSYLTRIAISGTHRYPGHGLLKLVYLGILISHISLAATTPALVLRSVWLALADRIPEHRALVRYTLPIWLYVSVTGVVVYVMLYQALPTP